RRARLAQREASPSPAGRDDVGALGRPLAGVASKPGSGLYDAGAAVDASRASRTGNIWPPASRRPPVGRVRNAPGPSGDDIELGDADPALEGAQRSTAEKVDALLSRLRARRLKDVP
ncbi:MAG: hypothetical protein AAF602_31015, partial [Myxococcota bacterium]